jgi:hypothetical protein
MAKKKVATVLGGKKHPRYALAQKISDAAHALAYYVPRSGTRTDKWQAKLDAAITAYTKAPKLQGKAHATAVKQAEAARKAQRRADERARAKARKEREREAAKKRNKAAKAKAKRDKVKAAKAAKKAAKNPAPRAVGDHGYSTTPPSFGSTPSVH